MNEEKNVWSDDDDFDTQMAKMEEKLSASRKHLEKLSDFEDDEKLEEKNEINSDKKLEDKDEINSENKVMGMNSNFESDNKLAEKNEINSENKVKKVKKDKKDKDENRDTFIKIRVTKSEKEQIRRKAKESNFTMSDYSRKLILKKKIAKPKYSHEHALMIATELRETKKALNKIGNNINQIAKLANTDSSLDDKNLNDLAKIRLDFDLLNDNLISLNRKTGA